MAITIPGALEALRRAIVGEVCDLFGHQFERPKALETAEAEHGVWVVRERCTRCGLTQGELVADQLAAELWWATNVAAPAIYRHWENQ